MRKKHILCILLIVVVLCLAVSTLVIAWRGVPIHLTTTNDRTETISFSGVGEVTTTKDVAKISFSFSELDKDVSAARKVVSEKAEMAYMKLKQLGIEERDMKTTRYNIHPEYEYVTIPVRPIPLPGQQGYDYSHGGRKQERRLVGYRVSHSSSIRIRDIDTVGNILDTISDLKPENVSNLTFTLDDEEQKQLEEEAEIVAITNAKEKAKRVAKQSGITLGKIVGVRFDSPRPYYRKSLSRDVAYSTFAVEEQSAPTTPVALGEDKITATVVLTYELK